MLLLGGSEFVLVLKRRSFTRLVGVQPGQRNCCRALGWWEGDLYYYQKNSFYTFKEKKAFMPFIEKKLIPFMLWIFI